MKDIQLNKIIEGKDLKKPEDVKAILDQINEIENADNVRKENSFNKKIDELTKENESLKAETAKVKDLSEQLSKKDSENKFLANKNYVYKNVNSNLDDNSIDELMAIVNYRMSKNDKLKFEDAVKNVSQERGFLEKAAEMQAIQDSVEQSPVGVRYKGSEPEVAPEDDNSEKGQRARFDSLVGGKKLNRPNKK